MSKLFTTRRRIAIVGIAGTVVVAGAGAAYAYFTSTGSGNGNATVGSAANWGVSAAAPTGTLLPCTAGTGGQTSTTCASPSFVQTITFTITNNSGGSQLLSTWLPTVESSASGSSVSVGGTTTNSPWIETGGSTTGGVYSGGNPVSGCEADWFSATVTAVNGNPPPTTGFEVVNGGSASVTVQVAMTDSSANQDNCEGKAPDVGLTVG